MLRLILLLAFGGVVFAAVFAGTEWFARTYRAPERMPRAAAIVVLSGAEDLRPGRDFSVTRTWTGIELWKAGAAPLLAVTGGRQATARMREVAIEEGVAPDAILVDPNSFSTLQNALLTARLEGIDPELPVIVVSDAFHLPRAWASFRWAGFRDIALYPSKTAPPLTSWRYSLMEAVKWPANGLRAAGASLAWALGVPDERVQPWLR